MGSQGDGMMEGEKVARGASQLRYFPDLTSTSAKLFLGQNLKWWSTTSKCIYLRGLRIYRAGLPIGRKILLRFSEKVAMFCLGSR